MQDREKQIEEMFNIIVDGVIDGEDNHGVPTGKTCLDIAEALYNAGYRKQNEGEWLVKWRSTFPQYEPSEYECSICGYKRTVLHNYCPNCGAKMKGGAE